MRFFGNTKKTIGNKYSEASCVRNTANNYDNICAKKSTIISVAKKKIAFIYGISNGFERGLLYVFVAPLPCAFL